MKYEAIIQTLSMSAVKKSLSFINGSFMEIKKVQMTPMRARMMPSFCVPGRVLEMTNSPPIMKMIPIVLTKST